MRLDLGKKTRLLIFGIGVVMLTSTAWRYRSAEWINKLVRVDGPAQVNIKFDNGSVREQKVSASDDHASSSRSDEGLDNTPGKLKKCLRGKEVIYTDRLCPADAKPAPVNGGSVTVLGGTSSKTENAHSVPQGPKMLKDALDLSGSENIKDKIMERATDR